MVTDFIKKTTSLFSVYNRLFYRREEWGRKPTGCEEFRQNGSFASGESWGLSVTTKCFFNSPHQQGKIREVGTSFLQTNSIKLVLTERGRFEEIVFANEQLLKHREFLFFSFSESAISV